jgi:hypothetical protein
LGLALVVTPTNLATLVLLVHYLLGGGHAHGTDLVGGGALIWCTKLLLSAVCSWELDRGSPPAPISRPRPTCCSRR